MLGHQFGQDFVLGLDLVLQVGDPFLICGVVGWPLLLEGRRAVFEELLLPPVEDRGLQTLSISNWTGTVRSNCWRDVLIASATPRSDHGLARRLINSHDADRFDISSFISSSTLLAASIIRNARVHAEPGSRCIVLPPHVSATHVKCSGERHTETIISSGMSFPNWSIWSAVRFIAFFFPSFGIIQSSSILFHVASLAAQR
jgi:hypothetical protein